MKIKLTQLRKTIQKVILECCEMDNSPAVSIDIEKEALDPILSMIDSVISNTTDNKVYPGSHESSAGRMMDYGNTKSDSHEGRMSKSKLFRMGKMAQSFHDRLEDGDDLPGWVQDKITTAEDRLTSAFEYIDYKLNRMQKEGCSCSENTVRGMAKQFLLRS
jgi:hypothetical protein